LTRSQIRRIATAALVALLGLSGTTALGFWQYSRAHRDDISQQVLAAPSVPVQSLLKVATYVPEDAFAHRVSLHNGTLLTTDALLSCNRFEHEQKGCWVLAPISVAPDYATVALLGFAKTSSAPALLSHIRSLGSVVALWQGRLQPAEVTDRGSAILRPSDTITSINVNELAARWKLQLLDGYVVISAPQRIQGLQTLTSPLILPPSGITWRNLFYAWQWWAFAVFVLFLLGRYVVDVRNEAPTLSINASSTREDHP
jgi:cytochrome oxidase assembly protein ShyY1